MTFILVCTILLALALMIGLIFMAAEKWHHPIGKVYAGAAFLAVAAVVTAGVESERQNPCSAYKTEMRYDPALKIVRPMKICAERGEWVE